MKFVLDYLRREEWSPYVAGVLLGVVGILSVWINNSLLGASGAFENLVGMIGQALAPQVFDNMYFNFIMPPGITTNVILIVGIFFGSMIAAATSGTLKFRVNDNEQWKQVYGPQLWKRWALLFVGGIILEYASGIAGGCTSGLAIAGGMLLDPAAFLFIGGMFASGIVTAMLIYGKRY